MVRKENWVLTKTGSDQNLYVCCVCEHKCSIRFPQKPDFCVCNLIEPFFLLGEIFAEEDKRKEAKLKEAHTQLEFPKF